MMFTKKWIFVASLVMALGLLSACTPAAKTGPPGSGLGTDVFGTDVIGTDTTGTDVFGTDTSGTSQPATGGPVETAQPTSGVATQAASPSPQATTQPQMTATSGGVGTQVATSA